MPAISPMTMAGGTVCPIQRMYPVGSGLYIFYALQYNPATLRCDLSAQPLYLAPDHPVGCNMGNCYSTYSRLQQGCEQGYAGTDDPTEGFAGHALVAEGKYWVRTEMGAEAPVNLRLYNVAPPAGQAGEPLLVAFEMRRGDYPDTEKKVHQGHGKKCGFVHHENATYHVLFHRDGVLSARAGE